MTTTWQSQSGIALVVTLILLLTLTIMASSVMQIVNRHADISNAVSHRPLATEAADACIHQSVEWFATPAGQLWLNGSASKNLASVGGVLNKKTVFDDTKLGARPINFTRKLSKALCTAVTVSKIDEMTVRGEGSEVGTETTYGTSYLKYIIKIVATGIFNVPTNSDATGVVLDGWNSSSSLATIEVVIEYEPN